MAERTAGLSGGDLLAALRHHVERWVAVRGSEVIVAEDSPREVIQFLRDHGLRADSVFRVPRDARRDIADRHRT